MLQAILENRFQLNVHRETKELPIYSLAVAEAGKLHEAEGDCSPPSKLPAPIKPGMPPPPPPCGSLRVFLGVGRLDGQKVTVTQLVANLSQFTGRMVLDKTGLTGKYDIDLTWTPEKGLPPLPRPDPNGPSLFTALQEQLGLKLESQTGPVELLVIDHAEKPSEN
jgi:uncharacterized protein (TIGR03435 family)